MTEMEKVIKGLEVCTRPGTRGCFYDIKECPYDENGCRMALMRDALALLKEQDPVEPELEGGGYNWWHVCGECHGAIDVSDNFCKHCGRRIKHEKKE